jgi:3',5'-nucleoside bisphosphate phosphatase
VRYNLADLHVHSHCSDGLWTPTQAVEEACRAGLQAFSLTDHDTVDGLAEAMEAGERLGLEVVIGTELSAHIREREVHILGYCFDRRDLRLNAALNQVHQSRYERGMAIVERLNGLGLRVTLDEVLSQAKGSPLGRPHIAAAMVNRGLVASKDEAFSRYIGDRGPAFWPKPYTAAEAVIELIHQAGGVSVLAHPGLSFPEGVLAELVACGLDGIEVFHPAHQPPQIEYYLQLAGRYHLLVSGGSDSHGEAEGIRIGEYGIGYEAVEALQRRAAANNP